MVDDDDVAAESRPPTLADLIALCRHLNQAAARYIVVGGMAIIQAGFVRATEDIDLLIDASPENVSRVREAMRCLPDNAAAEVRDTDVRDYTVVRVADEIVVDLMKSACGIDTTRLSKRSSWSRSTPSRFHFARPALLWRMKQTARDKDRLDRFFLERPLSDGEGQ